MHVVCSRSDEALITEMIIFGIPCFHRIDKLNNFSISKCEYKLVNGSWWHVIHFREGLQKNELKYFESYVTPDYVIGRNDRYEIIRFEERLNSLPTTTLLNLSMDSSHEMVAKCVNYLITYIVSYTGDYMVNDLIRAQGNQGTSTLLQTFVVCHDSSLAYTNHYLAVENKNTKVLMKQMLEIFNILKMFLFTKKKTKSKVHCPNCKLKSFYERFIHYDYVGVHKVFCNPDYVKDEDRLQLLGNLITDEAKLDLALNILKTYP